MSLFLAQADQPIALPDVRFRGTGGLEPSTLRRRPAQRCSRTVFIRAGTATAGIGGPAPSRGHGVEAGAAPGHTRTKCPANETGSQTRLFLAI
jgi:hypothetical protein